MKKACYEPAGVPKMEKPPYCSQYTDTKQHLDTPPSYPALYHSESGLGGYTPQQSYSSQPQGSDYTQGYPPQQSYPPQPQGLEHTQGYPPQQSYPPQQPYPPQPQDAYVPTVPDAVYPPLYPPQSPQVVPTQPQVMYHMQQNAPRVEPRGNPVQVESFLCLAIIAMCCCFCFGVIALSYSSKARSHSNIGDGEAARRNATYAKRWSAAAIAAGGFTYLFGGPLIYVIFLFSLSSSG